MPHLPRVAIVLFLLVLPFASFLPPAHAIAAGAPSEAELKALLDPIREKHKLPALGAAIVNSKGLIVAAVVGVRKQGTAVAATVNDKFHIGSDTKAMTATLIGRLVEAGKLNWDTPLSVAFPDLAAKMPEELKAVTLTHLLSHRSGLPGDFKDRLAWVKLAKVGDLRKQRKEVVRLAAAEGLEAKPGTKFIYSNMNYVIAAAMAEQVERAPWEELITNQMFGPLGMRSAGFGTPAKPGKTDQPWPHDKDGKPVEPNAYSDNVPAMGPAGRVHCSLPDWAKYIADQLKGARGEAGLLKAETYKELNQSPFPDKFYSRGGWGGGLRDGSPWYAHDGSNRSNYASAFLIPKLDVAFLVVTNQGEPNAAGQKGCEEAREAIAARFLKP